MKKSFTYIIVVGFTLFSCNLEKKQTQVKQPCVLESTEGGFYVAEYYSCDSEKVYFKNELIEKADLSSFKIIGTSYGTEYGIDQSHVYYRGEVIEHADSSSFRLLNFDYGVDSSRVYFQEKNLVGADPKSFVRYGLGYWGDDKFIYHEGIQLEDVDVKTFRVLEKSFAFAQDKNTVFLRHRPYRNIDPNLVEAIQVENPDLLEFLTSGLRHDTKRAFCEVRRSGEESLLVSTKISGAAIHLFDSNYGPVFRDSENVYWECRQLPEADVNTYEPVAVESNDRKILSRYFLRDIDSVFFNDRLIPEVSPEDFKPLRDSRFAKTENQVYFEDQLLIDADFDSFEVVCRGRYSINYTSPPDTCGGLIGKDKNRIFDF